jgi:hypothetical protein
VGTETKQTPQEARVIAMVAWYKSLGRSITWQEGAAFKAGYLAGAADCASQWEECPRCEGHCRIYDYAAMQGPAQDFTHSFNQDEYVIDCPACQGSGCVPRAINRAERGETR